MIVGAGLAGLIAAHAWPRERVVEAAPEPTERHKALLRFRSTAVADLVGIEFRPVTVRKAIYSKGGFQAPNPRLANLYAQKVIGKVIDRSIWNLEPVTRFIAPEDLYAQLVDSVGDRIEWATPADFMAYHLNGRPVISTAPLPIALRQVGINNLTLSFDRAPIVVKRYRVLGADVFQTVYFPEPDTTLYRASMTGDLLICEFTREPHPETDEGEQLALAAFGLTDLFVEPLGSVEQKYGKIAPVEDNTRKALLAKLTNEHGIFSLGRFATWRNILLDDVVKDIAVIKRLMKAHHYDAQLLRGYNS